MVLEIEEKKNASEKPKEEKSVKTMLHAMIEPNAWIIDSGCSNHMTDDNYGFINLKRYDGWSMKFFREDGEAIWGIGSISIDCKHKTDVVYYVEGLRHGLWSAG